MSVKFKVVPVMRWQIVRVVDTGNQGGTANMGEFADRATAERVGKLLAAGENVPFEGIAASQATAIGRPYQSVGAQLPPGMSGWQDLANRDAARSIDQALNPIFTASFPGRPE